MRPAGQSATEEGEPRGEASLPGKRLIPFTNGPFGRTAHLPGDPVLRLSVLIICAYVSSSFVARRDLPSVITSVGDTMRTVSTTSGNHIKNIRISATAVGEEAKAPIPVVPVNNSVFDDYIICLEDGSRYKYLTRHLRSSYEMSPDDYRAKWNLPASYPMTAPATSRYRSKISKEFQSERRAGVKQTAMTRSKDELS